MSFSTPILLLVFNRPEATGEMFNAIRRLQPKELYVAADGPRKHVAGEEQLCIDARNVILKNVTWDCTVKTLLREENLGCKLAVSSAITWFFENVEDGIILEDDCVPDETFFTFCSSMLERYKDDYKVMHIGGNNFMEDTLSVEHSYYFSKIIHIWGWATWRRAWALYDIELKNTNELSARFTEVTDNKQAKKYWINNFKLVKTGRLNTWDYQWVYSIWVNSGLGITPAVNLVSNIGFGEDATHTKTVDETVANLKRSSLVVSSHPEVVQQNRSADELEMLTFLQDPAFMSKGKRVLSILKNLLRQ